jgi:hypothetical protein
VLVNLESWAADSQRPRRTLRLDVEVEAGKIKNWQVSNGDEILATLVNPSLEVKLALGRNFEFKAPLEWLLAKPVAGAPSTSEKVSSPVATTVRLRFSIWQNRLPVDALPLEGWIELSLLSEDELTAQAF